MTGTSAAPRLTGQVQLVRGTDRPDLIAKEGYVADSDGTRALRRIEVRAEGEMADGMALWPNDPKRRIDIFFEERPPNFVESIRITDPRSRWRIGGLGVGSRLDAVLRANGRPVEIGGFGWDYGGGVDPRGGKLARWPGGCRIGLVMDVGRDVSEVPDGIQGDGLVLRADDPRLKAARPEVTKIFISWF